MDQLSNPSHPIPSIPCCYSALIFISNAIVAYQYEYYFYSGLFTTLIVTSLFYHSTKTVTAYWIDKTTAFSIVGYGGYVFFDKIANGVTNHLYSSIIVGTFLATIVLYYYGHAKGCFCFAEDHDESDRWHQLMHLLTSIGHHFIVIL